MWGTNLWNLFSLAEKSLTKSNGWKLQLYKFRLERKCKCLTVRVMNHWNNLPWAVVDSPSLAILKSRWDVHLKDLLYFKQDFIQGSPTACVTQGVRLDDHNGPLWPWNLWTYESELVHSTQCVLLPPCLVVMGTSGWVV